MPGAAARQDREAGRRRRIRRPLRARAGAASSPRHAEPVDVEAPAPPPPPEPEVHVAAAGRRSAAAVEVAGGTRGRRGPPPPAAAAPPAAAPSNLRLPRRRAAAGTRRVRRARARAHRAADAAAAGRRSEDRPGAARAAAPSAAGASAGVDDAAAGRHRQLEQAGRRRVPAAPAAAASRAVRRAPGAYPRPQAPMGGPRPLPSQPVRPSQPLRPNVPGYRPPPPRPSGPRSSGPRRDQPRMQAPTTSSAPPPPVTRTITLAEGMTVSDLALKLDVKAKDVLKKLMDKRMMMTINSTLDTETTSMIAREFGADVKMQTFEEELLQVESEDIEPRGHRHARPGRDRHGPRRPRQDDAARRHPRDPRRRARSRRHHPAHRRLRGAGQRPQRRVPRHAWPRGVHDDARPRRARHRRRRPGRRGRRRRHAADARGDRPRAGGRTCRSSSRSTRSTRRTPIPDRVKKELSDLGPGAGRLGRPDRHRPAVGEEAREHSGAARDGAPRHGAERAEGQPEAQRVGHRARSEAGQGARPGGDDPRAGRHAARRRHADRRHHRRQGARDHRRPRQADQERGAVHAGGSARPRRPALAGRRLPGARRTRPRRGRSRTTAQTQAKDKALGGQGRAPHARIAAGPDFRRRDEGAADHHQVGRAGLGRSAGRHADEAERRARQDPHHPQRRRRDQRVRRAARRGVERDHHRVQRPAGPQRRRASPIATASTSACTRSSTTSPTR